MAVAVQAKSVRNTFLYSQVNKNGVLDENIKLLLTKGVTLTEKEIGNQIATINSFYKGVLKTPVLEAFKKGIVKPMIFPKGITANHKIPNSFPFILVPAGGSVNAVAIVDNYASANKELDAVNIDTQKLYTFLETAYVARGIQLKYAGVRNVVLNGGPYIWAQMFVRLLNKRLALNVNKIAYEKVCYLAAKYFIINILGYDESSNSTTEYAAKTSKNVSRIELTRLDQEFSVAAKENLKAEGESVTNPTPYKDISTFIITLSKMGRYITSGISQITVRDYLRDFITMYGNASLFGLEHLAYFVFNIFAATNGAFLNNQYAYKDILGKSGVDLYGRICGAVRNEVG